jgi:1-acyl-sn-glycerol-3-phosphate acyltransferase
MKKILDYLLTPIFHLHCGLMILLFYPIQVLALHVFGDKARRRTVDWLNWTMVKGLNLMGCKVKFAGLEKIPENRPIVIVANHQSIYDIPAVGHVFRKCNPKYISKIELSKNLLSISYNLKHSQSALIDRTKGAQAVKEIFKLGRLIESNNYAACIYPEGTRSRTGGLQPFMSAGINTLLRAAPSAVVVPFVIDGHSRMMEKGYFPLKFGQRITYTVLDPIEPKGMDVEELVGGIHDAIEQTLTP